MGKGNNLTAFDVVARCMLGGVVVGGAVLGATPFKTSADDGNSSMNENIAVSISSACSMSSTVTEIHSATITNGTNKTDIGSTSLKAVCNDAHGWDIFAVGYNELTSVGETALLNVEDQNLKIPTGTATSGGASQWSMKLTAATGTYQATIDYASNYAAVPSLPKKVAHYNGTTDQTEGSTINTTYQAYVSPTQAAGTYSGKVKYTLAHPADDPQGITSILYMQDMSAAVCNKSAIGVMTTLVDTRDNKEYQVAKLKDGKCWMVDNLRYGGVDATGAAHTMTSSDSDVTRDWSLTANTTTGSAYTTSTSWNETYTKAEYCPDDSMTGEQHYGYCYNWYAAVAGSVAGDFVGTATQSICPKGWTLPENGEYGNLLYQHHVIPTPTTSGTDVYSPDGFDTMLAAPLQFLRAGRHGTTGTGVYNRGSNGYYWSRTSYSATNARYLGFRSTDVNPQNNLSKGYGFTVRCVAL